ncbi:MAG: FAD-binding protein [Alphaproteobacteria bacterium]|nr:FAD-binding protein [Alphaproteobacteria bacterium]
MGDLLEPADEKALGAIIAEAAAAGRPLEVSAGRSKAGLGRPVAADARLSLTRLSGIAYYEPGELVMEAGPATPLTEIEAALAENNQQLAFEPPDLGPLYGAAPGRGTIGGVIACNLAGSRRPFAGAARDHVLGIRAISGRGEAFASGGRVVKNVTGYDMSKLLAGSYGTLAVLSSVTFKVLPRAETVRTALLFGQDPAAAAATMAAAVDGPWDISAAAYLPAAEAARSAVDYVSAAHTAVTALRIEGSRDGAVVRCQALRAALTASGPGEELHGARSRTLWAEIASAALLPGGGAGGDMIWRLSLPPAAGLEAAVEIADAEGGAVVADWAGGLIWLAMAADGDAESAGRKAAALRAAVAAHGGHATLVRAAETLRREIPVFETEAPALAALTRRIKENFDPRGILNPGRMVEGL